MPGNNMVEQDHRATRQVRPMQRSRSQIPALATLEGSQVANMIRKGQLMPGLCPFLPVSRSWLRSFKPAKAWFGHCGSSRHSPRRSAPLLPGQADRGQAAIDGILPASNECRVRRGQKQQQVGDIFGLSGNLLIGYLMGSTQSKE